ncbi:hypothetical protein Dimus_037382, partial [Dionaea muscipula]
LAGFFSVPRSLREVLGFQRTACFADAPLTGYRRRRSISPHSNTVAHWHIVDLSHRLRGDGSTI